jgi:uncharacterized protein
VLILGLADVCRDPTRQVIGRLYVGFVRTAYQPLVRPLLKGKVRCRYCPSCSDYSIAAVSRFGMVQGTILTVKRVSSCTTGVPLGTVDEVPIKLEEE